MKRRINFKGRCAGPGYEADNAAWIDIGKHYNASGPKSFGGAKEWPNISVNIGFPADAQDHTINKMVELMSEVIKYFGYEAPEEPEDRDSLRDAAIRKHAEDLGVFWEGDLEMDDNAMISESDENGCYVQVWKWVDFDGTEFDKFPEPEHEDGERTATIIVREACSVLHPLDTHIAGIYKTVVSSDLTEEAARESALDWFHSTVAIKVLDDFYITVELEPTKKEEEQ